MPRLFIFSLHRPSCRGTSHSLQCNMLARPFPSRTLGYSIIFSTLNPNSFFDCFPSKDCLWLLPLSQNHFSLYFSVQSGPIGISCFRTHVRAAHTISIEQPIKRMSDKLRLTSRFTRVLKEVERHKLTAKNRHHNHSMIMSKTGRLVGFTQFGMWGKRCCYLRKMKEVKIFILRPTALLM